MAKIFITGSADGLGKLAARQLAGQGHEVVLHARNEQRAREAMAGVPNAAAVLIGDLANLEETKGLANDVNESGSFDAVIHNAGVYRAPAETILTVNTLSPYILTCLIQKPERLIYLSSSLHLGGTPSLNKLTPGEGGIGYSTSKLHMVMLAKAMARKWPGVYSNAVDPGWVPTKMGGPGASDDLQKGYETQAWLAVSTDAGAQVSGRYFYHRHEARYHAQADDLSFQDDLLARCEKVTGVRLPMA